MTYTIGYIAFSVAVVGVFFSRRIAYWLLNRSSGEYQRTAMWFADLIVIIHVSVLSNPFLVLWVWERLPRSVPPPLVALLTLIAIAADFILAASIVRREWRGLKFN